MNSSHKLLLISSLYYTIRRWRPALRIFFLKHMRYKLLLIPSLYYTISRWMSTLHILFFLIWDTVMSANKGIMIETRHYDPRNHLDQIRQDFTAWMILLFLLLFTIFLIQIRDTAFDFVSTFTTMLKWYVTEKLNNT